MQANYALSILEDGFQNLISRKGVISIDDMEAEVNFQCCRYILENYGDKVHSVPDVNSINDVVSYNVIKFNPIITDFLRAGNQMFSENWQVDKDGIFIQMIAANLSWSGMWDYLVTYFMRAHGENLDDATKESLIFYSQFHRRYEYNSFKSESKVERNVNITFFNDGAYAMISIEPTLSNKKAYLISKEGKEMLFRGEDQDYRFVMQMDDYDEIEKFTLELINRGIRIEYF